MDLFTETIRPPIQSRLLQAAMGLLSDPAAHEEGPGIATGISPVALIFSLPLLTCTAWQRTVCIFVQPLNAATHRWHLRRPENHHIQCMVLQ
jgi:hypothetical protein